MWSTHPFWQLVELAPLAAGGYVAVFNFAVCFIRPAVARARGWSRNVSPAPLLGSILLVPFAASHATAPGLLIPAAVLILLDTGGVVWIAATLAWLWWRAKL